MNWVCPYCRFPQVLTAQNSDRGTEVISEGYHDDDQAMVGWSSIRCLNDECKQRTFSVGLYKVGEPRAAGEWFTGLPIRNWRLLPESTSKPQPEYIPAAIRADYREACVIRDLSPKASATLARRCLQGMIRDFCGITENRLIDELNKLKKLVADNVAPRGVDEDAVKAIDHVREIGNIGAHMEKDINIIVDVEPGEAQVLIELLETLFEEWYVARHNREQRFAKLNAIAEEKKAAKKAQPALIAPEPASLGLTDLTSDG